MKITKSELKQLIREALKEELARAKPLTESPKKANRAFMKVQDFIVDSLGWDIIDCTQEDDYSMLLKCDINGNDDTEALEDFCYDVNVEASVMDSGSSDYDLRVYLNY